MMMEGDFQSSGAGRMKTNKCIWGSSSAATVSAVIICYLFVDLPVAKLFHDLSQDTLDVFEWITIFGYSTGYLILSMGLYIFFRWIRENRLYANRSLLVFSAIAVAGLVANAIKPIAGRARPIMFFEHGQYGFFPFHTDYEFNSFPSGHATAAVAVAVSLSMIWPRYRIVFMLLACLVVLSRIVLPSHYLGDVVAGAYIGASTALILSDFIHVKPCSSG
jgi:membrane-associated phospholipid phosphatase